MQVSFCIKSERIHVNKRFNVKQETVLNEFICVKIELYKKIRHIWMRCTSNLFVINYKSKVMTKYEGFRVQLMLKLR